MPWVPIHESGLDYEFFPDTSYPYLAVAEMVDSTISFATAGWDSSSVWDLWFDGELPFGIRITPISYLAATGYSGFTFDPPYFKFVTAEDTMLSHNQAPPYPASVLPNNEGITTWLPNPVEFHGGPFEGVGYDPTFVQGEGWFGADESYAFLIEVWVDGPGPGPGECSYNCSCDPQAGTRNIDTLGNLASRLIRRLGFVDPLGDAEVRTLGDFRTELMIRLGYAANAANPPAGMLSLIDAVVNESQQLLWRRLELDQEGAQPPRMVEGTDVNVLDYPLVFAHALGQLKAHYNKPDAKLYLDQAEKQLGDYMRRSPPSIQFLARDFLKEAQRFLYQKAASFRQSRFFYWPLEKGVRFYDFAQNEGECEHRFVPELIEGVYVTEGDDCTTERWRELAAGINPLLYNGGVRESWPYRYEFRQCIEIFPAPDGRAGYLRVKAKFELQPFEDDGDYTTIDADLVFLQALAVGQEHFQQKNAQLTHALVRSRLGDIIAGEHHTRRYIPDDPFEPPANPPRPRDGFIEDL